MKLSDPDTDALLKAGFIKTIDLIAVLLVFSLFVTGVVQAFLYGLTATPFLFFVLAIFVLLLWIICLIYRASFFVLKLTAKVDLENVAREAARIVLAFQRAA